MSETMPNNIATQTTAEIINTAVDKSVDGSQENLGRQLTPQQAADALERLGATDEVYEVVNSEIAKLSQGYGLSESESAYLILNPKARAILYRVAGKPQKKETFSIARSHFDDNPELNSQV